MQGNSHFETASNLF